MNPVSLRNMALLSILCIFFTAQFISAQDEVKLVNGPSKKVGNYTVTLRLPEGGLVAEEEQQLEFQVVDNTHEDPVLGPAPIVRASIFSEISMPSMPSMPKVEEVAHTEGIPGNYGLHPTFAHGGEFVLLLKVKPPVGDSFTVDFPINVLDPGEVAKRKPGLKPFKADFKTEPSKIKAGEPTKFHITIFANKEMVDADGRPTGKRETVPVKNFEKVHEKYLHMIVVRKDLGVYAHEHPELQPDGTFLYPAFTFPTAGDYQIFMDTAPKGAGGQVLLASVKVEGKDKLESRPLSSVEKKLEQTANEVTVTRKDGEALPAKKTTLVTFSLKNTKTGEPITDLEPYLGAMGHLIMIREDAQTFVHSHPDERDPKNGKDGTLTFMVRPPKVGLYRGWMEFQRAGKLSRVDFVFEVKN